VGLANAAAWIGGFVGSIAFGYIVELFRSYDVPFAPMAALLLLAAALWLRVDASQELVPGA
jgi:predicted MFS family arabinose efflux permease